MHIKYGKNYWAKEAKEASTSERAHGHRVFRVHDS